YLTTAQYDAALARPLALASGGRGPPPAPAVYPLQPATATSYPDFVDYVTAWRLQHYPASEVYGGGLRVQTTLDPAVQAAAYNAVNTTLASNGLAPPIDMAMAAVQPQTGFVEALVGGRHFGHGGPLAQDNL